MLGFVQLMIESRHNLVVDTVYGPLIVNRHAGEFDALAKCGRSSSHRGIEIVAALAYCCGPHTLAIDVGSCFGTFAIALGRTLKGGGGAVVAFEPQQWLFHCLCGSVALNDLSNVECRNEAVGHTCGICTLPGLDYTKAASFGSLPIQDWATDQSWEDLGQRPSDALSKIIGITTLDALGLSPGLIKIDTEGMEVHVLRGAEETVRRNRPVLYVEHLKCDKDALDGWLAERDYLTYTHGCDYISIPIERRDKFPALEYEDQT